MTKTYVFESTGPDGTPLYLRHDIFDQRTTGDLTTTSDPSQALRMTEALAVALKPDSDWWPTEAPTCRSDFSPTTPAPVDHTSAIDDPGIHASNPSPGTKHDQGKPRMSLVMSGFPLALKAIGEVATFGAKKYSDDGWVTLPNGINRYTDALHRHLLDEASGDTTDAESECLHAAHAAWNALARLELQLRQASPEQAPAAVDQGWQPMWNLWGKYHEETTIEVTDGTCITRGSIKDGIIIWHDLDGNARQWREVPPATGQASA